MTMEPIIYFDRKKKKKCEERVYGAKGLRLLYGQGLATTLFGKPLAHLLARFPFISSLYGRMQNSPCSKKKVKPFIKEFEVDTSEFLDTVDSFASFNDFFIRRLKPEARPIAVDPNTAIIPADGRYLFYQHIEKAEGFVVKGEKFDLATLLENQELASKYAHGSMVIARLCPTDYHRFHFPFDCIPSETRYINGWLYSVNPAAIKKNVQIFAQNKRTLCTLKSPVFGDVLFMEIGATFVGAIHQTYKENHAYSKGAEKGYFSFGASSLILLFPPNSIQFDEDLLKASADHTEILCLMGQSMGKRTL